MPIKRLIIHAGYPKAGSTSLQETMYHNRDRLARKGFLYPSSWKPNHGLALGTLFDYNVFQLFDKEMLGFAPEQIDEQRTVLIESLKAELAETSCETLIISGEAVCHFSPASLARSLTFFRTLLNKPEIKIVLYVRNPVDYYASALNIHVWNMGRSLDCLEPGVRDPNTQGALEADLINGRPYCDRLPVLFEAVGREQVEVYQFEAAIRECGGPVEHFLSLLGFTSAEIKNFTVIKGNESKSQLLVEFYDYLNRMEPYYSEKKPLLKINPRRLKYNHSLLQNLAGPRFSLPQSLRSELAGKFIPDARWLKDQTGIDYLPELAREQQTELKAGPQEPSDVTLADLQRRFSALNEASRPPVIAFLEYKAENTGHPKYKNYLSTLKNIDRILRDAETKMQVFVNNRATESSYYYYDFERFQIYVDYGEGFNERDSFTYKRTDLQPLTVDLSFKLTDNVTRIRINPSLHAALVYFEELQVNGQTDGYRLESKRLDGSDNLFIFIQDGPQIFLSAEAPITSLRLVAVIDRIGSCFSSLNRHQMLTLLNAHLISRDLKIAKLEHKIVELERQAAK